METFDRIDAGIHAETAREWVQALLDYRPAACQLARQRVYWPAKKGQELPVEVSSGELTMNGRRVFTGFIRDISERKQAEEQREKLGRAQVDLAHINRVSTMGELTALGTPDRVIQGRGKRQPSPNAT